jgi:trk system potassium uptake protein
MLHYFPAIHAFSPIVAVFGLLMLLPLAFAHLLADGAERQYDISFLVTLLAGVLLWVVTRPYRRDLQVYHGLLVVSLTWTLLPAFAALPLMFVLGVSFTDGYFEAASAMTTTGATVLTGLDELPDSINIWRAMLQWVGGMGVVVLAVAILPLLGVGGRRMFLAEVPGPMKESRLTPRIEETAKGLWTVYCLLTVACLLAYRWAGMSWVDALIHAFTTLPLGGFSSHDASFAFFNSPLIEAVAVVFMVLAGINFSTHFLALRRLNLKNYYEDSELQVFLTVLAVSCAGIAAYLWLAGTYPEFLTAFRFASFNVVSIATTTGYSSTDYNAWPLFAPMWMLLLCSFAGCSGSTAGGMKMARAQLMIIQSWREMVRLLHPQAILPVKVRGRHVEPAIIFSVLSFMIAFGATILATTLLLVATGLDFMSAFTAAVASVTNTGPGLNEVGPAGNYASLLPFQKWVCVAAMLLGRLELFTLLILFTPGFWRR